MSNRLMLPLPTKVGNINVVLNWPLSIYYFTHSEIKSKYSTIMKRCSSHFPYPVILLMLLFLSGWINVTSAQQRRCDIEVVCDQPSGTVRNGKALPLRFEMWNRGPDVRFSHDTTLYKLYRVVDQDTQVVYQGMIRGRDGDTIPVGGASAYADNYEIRFNYPDRKDTFEVDFCVLVASRGIYANGDTLQFSYYDSNSSNNNCCKKVKVIPQAGTAIPEMAQGNSGWGIYPNPAKDVLYLRAGTGAFALARIKVYDMAGRNWLEQDFFQQQETGFLTLPIDQLPSGLYQLVIYTSEGEIQTKKFAVRH